MLLLCRVMLRKLMRLGRQTMKRKGGRNEKHIIFARDSAGRGYKGFCFGSREWPTFSKTI